MSVLKESFIKMCEFNQKCKTKKHRTAKQIQICKREARINATEKNIRKNISAPKTKNNPLTKLEQDYLNFEKRELSIMGFSEDSLEELHEQMKSAYEKVLMKKNADEDVERITKEIMSMTSKNKNSRSYLTQMATKTKTEVAKKIIEKEESFNEDSKSICLVFKEEVLNAYFEDNQRAKKATEAYKKELESRNLSGTFSTLNEKEQIVMTKNRLREHENRVEFLANLESSNEKRKYSALLNVTNSTAYEELYKKS